MNQEAKEIQEKYGLTDKQMKGFIPDIGMKWNPRVGEFYIPDYDERDDIDHSTEETFILTPVKMYKAGLISKEKFISLVEKHGTKFFSEDDTFDENDERETQRLFTDLTKKEGGKER